jgi:hypothetical protein
MKTTVKEFLGKRKKTIRNTIIGVTLTVTGVCLYSLNQMDKKIDIVDEDIVDKLEYIEIQNEDEA